MSEAQIYQHLTLKKRNNYTEPVGGSFSNWGGGQISLLNTQMYNVLNLHVICMSMLTSIVEAVCFGDVRVAECHDLQLRQSSLYVLSHGKAVSDDVDLRVNAVSTLLRSTFS